MPTFEVYLKDRLFWRYSVDQDKIRIGRSEENEIVLTDSVVSRLHVVVQYLSNQYILTDKSTNGTFVNDNRIDKIELSDQDHIRIGDYSLIFHEDDPEKDVAKPGDRYGTATLIVSYNQQTGSLAFKKFFLLIHHNNKTRTFPINKEKMIIGSDQNNDIRLQDPSVSKYHAIIEYRQDHFFIKDQNSAEGTYVDDKKISETVLNPDTEIRIGKIKLSFTTATSDATISPSQESSFNGMLGQSTEMRKIYSLIKRIAPSNVPVLLQGETGTGKELATRAIHSLSNYSKGPLVIINCGAIPKNLIESEFFGHKKGSFTGSQSERIGAFERAHGGTIFLDEIGELPIDLQPRLLRVIEDKMVTRVGADQAIPTDFRLISATNRKLEEEIEEGNFRQDLFFRINVIPITLPPLRERKEDIPALADFFLKTKATTTDFAGRLKLSSQAKSKLMKHDWPGNVREIKNVIERAVLMSDKEDIDAEDLSFIPIGKEDVEESMVKGTLSLEEVEKKVILQTLKTHNWDKKITAEVLGVAYSTLWAKIKKYDIKA